MSGHSMGGYGTLRIGMKYPQVFGALYAMSSAVLLEAPNADSVKKELERMAEGIKPEPRSFVNGVVDLLKILTKTNNVLADTVQHGATFRGLQRILIESGIFQGDCY